NQDKIRNYMAQIIVENSKIVIDQELADILKLDHDLVNIQKLDIKHIQPKPEIIQQINKVQDVIINPETMTVKNVPVTHNTEKYFDYKYFLLRNPELILSNLNLTSLQDEWKKSNQPLSLKLDNTVHNRNHTIVFVGNFKNWNIQKVFSEIGYTVISKNVNSVSRGSYIYVIEENAL